jgi:hypothetical protein
MAELFGCAKRNPADGRMAHQRDFFVVSDPSNKRPHLDAGPTGAGCQMWMKLGDFLVQALYPVFEALDTFVNSLQLLVTNQGFFFSFLIRQDECIKSIEHSVKTLVYFVVEGVYFLTHEEANCLKVFALKCH